MRTSHSYDIDEFHSIAQVRIFSPICEIQEDHHVDHKSAGHEYLEKYQSRNCDGDVQDKQ
jgi:hypothetical protein